MTESGSRGFTPDGKIIATETRSFAWVSVHGVTICDIPHVFDGGFATEVALSAVTLEDLLSSPTGFATATAAADGGTVVGVGNGKPRTI